MSCQTFSYFSVYQYFFLLLSDITYFDERLVCLLTGEIIQRIVCAVRAATN